jgi:hypothetical protein
MLTFGQSLMLAVLEQAVTDLKSVSGKVARQARSWFLARENGNEYVFSFARICREFGYDPLSVRSQLFNGSNGNGKARNGRSKMTNGRSEKKGPACSRPLNLSPGSRRIAGR